jgi:hypothetical protein
VGFIDMDLVVVVAREVNRAAWKAPPPTPVV